MNDLITLGIETSGILCAVAWWQNDQTLLEYSLEIKNAHSTVLADFIKKGHKTLAIDARSISLVSVASGPGSFTGLRIGMSFAKGFCLGGNIPLVAVTNFHVLAALAEKNAQPVYTLIEARHDRYYTGLFSAKSGVLTKKYVAPKEQLATEIPAGAQIIIHEEAHKGTFQKCLPAGRTVVPGDYKSSILCELGRRIFSEQPLTPLDDIEPLYLQGFAGVL